MESNKEMLRKELASAEEAVSEAHRELKRRRERLLALQREAADIKIKIDRNCLTWSVDGLEIDMCLPPIDLVGTDLAEFYSRTLDRTGIALDHASAANVALALRDAAGKVRSGKPCLGDACSAEADERRRSARAGALERIARVLDKACPEGR